LSAQARRVLQQAIMAARDDDERHVRHCIEQYIKQQHQQEEEESYHDAANNTNDGHNNYDSNRNDYAAATNRKLVDMIPVVPLALAQSAKVNSEAQRSYQLDAQMEYLLQELDSPWSNRIPQLQQMQTLLNNIID
jgi:hypothetical protein